MVAAIKSAPRVDRTTEHSDFDRSRSVTSFCSDETRPPTQIDETTFIDAAELKRRFQSHPSQLYNDTVHRAG